jgi:hypothetical protein
VWHPFRIQEEISSLLLSPIFLTCPPRYRMLHQNQCLIPSPMNNMHKYSVVGHLYVVYHTYPDQNISAHRIDMIHWNKNCSLIHDLPHNLHSCNMLMLNSFFLMVIWNCIMTKINLMLSKLLNVYGRICLHIVQFLVLWRRGMYEEETEVIKKS